jgi:polyisoprenoid-binding protein YceI
MHLDILGSGRYPEASFTPVRAAGKLAPRGWSQLDLSGIFKIHGSDRELALHFQGERLGGQHIASAHFAIPYAPWGMKNPRDFLLKVDKTVGIDIQAAGNASS